MTVELKPETERLVHEELNSGHFHSVDELIVESVQAWREKQVANERSATSRFPKKNFADFLLESPLRGSGLKFQRQKDDPRPIDLE